jgi:hypothetical protein
MFKNLAKKHVEKFKQRRADKRDPTISERKSHYTPLRIYLHSTISIFTSDWVLMEGQNPAFEIPNGDLNVLAIGKMPFDSGMTFWRIYVEDNNQEEFILSILEDEGTVQDILLLRQIVTVVPNSQAQLERYTTQIGFHELKTDDGLAYDRVWGDEFTEKLKFTDNEYEEHFVSKEEVQDFTNQYMLYSRDIESGETEWLFVGLEEGDEFGELAFQVGFSIDKMNLEVV